MARKRDRTPEAVLERVIRELEQSDALNHPSHHRAVIALLSGGPLLCPEALQWEVEQPDPEVSLIRAELITFLRDTVRLDGTGAAWYGIGLMGHVQLRALAAAGDVTGAASGSVRDVAVLQLFLLMREVGLRNIRVCGAIEPGGCRRLFVKTYRRAFCSARCQQRVYKRDQRRQAREKQAQSRARRKKISA